MYISFELFEHVVIIVVVSVVDAAIVVVFIVIVVDMLVRSVAKLVDHQTSFGTHEIGSEAELGRRGLP